MSFTFLLVLHGLCIPLRTFIMRQVLAHDNADCYAESAALAENWAAHAAHLQI
ncbi:hypothetical protein SAMN04488032_101479 [Pacificibacter marinus]|uniref:Uncharacterized protein n=1 Tax=Pacificibacter marinus TaxID=658057 RepID=A0A1Y5RAW2_9RHOB|nr:hypothetical protein SAMN04488032_101479 [Pacificibacter marinus]SLN13171.1 hypothetical protein PAM7971_00168 [Pacificibacter marinus]